MSKHKVTGRMLHGILFAYRYLTSPLGENDEGYLGVVVQFSGQPGLILLNKNTMQEGKFPELTLKKASKKNVLKKN